MIDFKILWDEKAWSQCLAFMEAGEYFDEMDKKLATEIAEIAEEYFKPMLNVRSTRTGDTARSIRHEIHTSGDEFSIEYYGLLSALYMDDGNFDPSDTRSVPLGKATKFFPVDARFGTYKPQTVIHGMGSLTPDAPTHWSMKTAEGLVSEGLAMDLLTENMAELLEKVVISK